MGLEHRWKERLAPPLLESINRNLGYTFSLISAADRFIFKTDPSVLSFTEETVELVSMRVEQLHLRIVNSTP